MPINKFITKLDLSRQSAIYTGETACYDGGIELGIPFSGYPSGVDLNNEISSVVIASESATFTGTTATTIFDIYGDWSEPSFSANTSGLTIPITPFSAETQIVGPYYTPTSTTVIDGNSVVLQYSAYSVTYSFEAVTEIVDTGGTVTYSGLTTATLQNFVYGSLDYTGSTRYMNVRGTTETERLIISSGATIGYTWTCVDSEGLGAWLPNSSADTNTYVTGGTLTGTDLILDWNTGGSVPPISLSGLTFTGNTSGDCINDIHVKNIHSCSPLNINPLDEGNVYFGSTSGVTIDVINQRIGVGTDNPQYSVQVLGNDSTFWYDPTSVGGHLLLSGNTSLPRFGLSIAPYLSKPSTGGNLGMRCWDDVSYPSYGKVGDMFVYVGNETNGLNIINGAGTNTDDYIRFYAGKYATATSDIHIQGSGATKGYIGMGTETPTEKLVVNGNVKIIGNSGSLTRSLTIGDEDEITFSTQGSSVADNIRLLSQPSSGKILLKNGSIDDRYTDFGQYSNYTSLIGNIGSPSGEMYIQNEAEESALVFRVGSGASASDVCYFLGDQTSVKYGPFSGVSNSKIVYAVEYLSVGFNASFGSVGSTAFAQDIRIDANGVLTTNTSDERLKENIKSLSGSLETILQLSGVSYNWKDRNSGGDDTRYGFIAQRVADVDTNLTTINKVDGYMGLKSDCFTPLIVESIKELYNNPSIPNYTPSSSVDTYGNVGNVTIDDNYLYIKTNNGWKRTTLESF